QSTKRLFSGIRRVALHPFAVKATARVAFTVTKNGERLVLRHRWSGRLLFLRQVSDESLSSQNHGRNTGCVLECRTGNLSRISNTELEHIAIGIGENVIANPWVILFLLSTAYAFDND